MTLLRRESYDVVVVGAGPNGLASAATFARQGLSVLILEANETVGGGSRSGALTLPGFIHDYCAAIHPMARVSPFFRSLPLSELGCEWRESPSAIAHPLDDGTAASLEQSIEATADGLGPDAPAYRKLIEPFARNASVLFDQILRPIKLFPRHPVLMARFGAVGLRSAQSIAERFRTAKARALFAGCSAHSFVPLSWRGSASFGIVLALAGHATGWPCARGGSQVIIEALVRYVTSLGVEIQVGRRVTSLRQIPPSRAVMFDLTPRQVAAIAEPDLPSAYVRKLRAFRYGPGVFKIDWALDGPIPWRAEICHRAATVHVGGTFEEIAAHEHAIWTGQTTERPFVLVAQQSLFDDSRAPAGKHTGWAYCHVPHGSTADMTLPIESQIERFAPGFGKRILARRTMNTVQYEAHDANFVGGDIAGGANHLQQFVLRPFFAHDPYSTPNPRLYMGSSSTPPGGGVHGMCGYWAAVSALRRTFGLSPRFL